MITKTQIIHQTWKFYFAPIAWVAFLIVLPAIYRAHWALAVIAAVFPGAFLFTWLGFLMHETWHKYVPTIPNKTMYNVYALLLVSDPQVYKMVHGHHHTHIHTWSDMEFHPYGEIKTRLLRIVNNLLEIFIGIAYLVAVSLVTVPRNAHFRDRYRIWKAAVSFFVWVVYLFCAGLASSLLFEVRPGDIVMAYVLAFWVGSVILHHSQLVEHGNLIMEGDWKERNLWTRNLRSNGILEKIFLFLTHNDSREHVLHHTVTGIYSRPFPREVPMPDKAVYVTLHKYRDVLKDMLLGRPSQR